MNFDNLSITALYSAMAVYALAFIFYAVDLARRSASVGEVESAAGATSNRSVGAQADGAGGTTTIVRDETRTEAGGARYGRSPALRIGVALTVIAWALHLSADVLRGVAAGRVPWANMYEFAMTGTLIIVTVYLLVNLKIDLRFLGTFITGLILIMLGVASVNFYVAVTPLPPALQSVWLIIHVFVASTGTGFFALGFGLSLAQLVQVRREATPGDTPSAARRLMATLPSAERLEALAYRINIIGFILWTFTLMAGAIWAEKAWGRYWGWDTKEVWTFIIWVIYAGYIHARATRGWRGSRAAWLAIVGFSAVMFNFTIVNIFFKGLHAYSGL